MSVVHDALSLLGDYYHVGKNSFLRFKEKGGKVHTIPAHHKAVEYLDAYLEQAGIDPLDKEQKRLPLFRTLDRTRALSTRRLDRHNLYRMLKERALAAGITADISVHSARATGITTYLENGGQLEAAQDIANHSDPRTTRLYDRRSDRLDRAEIERVQY